MQVIVQLIEHDDVAFGQGVEPWTGKREHLPGSVRLLVHFQFRLLSVFRLMFHQYFRTYIGKDQSLQFSGSVIREIDRWYFLLDYSYLLTLSSRV